MEETKNAVGKAQMADAIRERKLRMLDNPSSVVLAPRTREGIMMVRLLFDFDRAVNRIRMKAGIQIPIEDVMKSFAGVKSFMSALEGVLRSFGDDAGYTGYAFYGQGDPEIKRSLAERRNSYVFVPKSDEGKGAAMLLRRLDPLILQFRTTCTDFAKSEQAVKSLRDIIADFHGLTLKLSELAGVQYKPPKGISSVIEESVKLTPAEQKESFPTKNKKDGS